MQILLQNMAGLMWLSIALIPILKLTGLRISISRSFNERVEKPLRMTLNTLRVFAPGLNKNKGRYICISSIYAKQIEPDYFSYSMAKEGN